MKVSRPLYYLCLYLYQCYLLIMDTIGDCKLNPTPFIYLKTCSIIELLFRKNQTFYSLLDI